MLTLIKLPYYIRISDDRTCDKLREHCNIHSEGERIALNFNITTVYIYNIAHGLEGIEADTYRKCNFKKRYT